MNTKIVETETNEETPLEYQLFNLSFSEPGAISYFNERLPADMVGILHGQTGLHEFYVALLDFYNKTGLDPIDPLAFKTWLELETEIYGALGGPGGVKVFLELVQSIEKSDAESVVKVLRHKANKRKQMDFLQELQGILTKKGHKSDDEVAQISQLTEQIRGLENDLDVNPLASVTTAHDIAARADHLMEMPDFLSTPFKSLNRAMGYTDDGGFFRGAVHAIIAPSGKGKSTFAKCLMNDWVEKGHTVLYVNFEEAQAHWETILFTQVIKENVYAKTAVWSKDERQERIDTFRNTLKGWGNRFMVRHDPDTSYFSDLEIWLRDIMGHNDIIPDVVIIDTIQSLIEKGKGARWGEFEYMMIRLEKLARDMNSVFIITAQQNTEAMKEKREQIKQSDTGGSIAIQQKSSVTIFITEKKLVSGDDSDEDYLMQLQIPKNRITGSTFMLNPPLVMYNDESKSYLDCDTLDDKLYESELTLESVLNPGTGDFSY